MTDFSEDLRKTEAEPSRRRGRPAGDGGGSGGGDGVRSLSRALALLEDVAAHAEGVTLGDLAQRADLAPSTAHRLLKTLESRRYVTQDAERGLWFTGVQAFIVGTGFLRNRDMVGIARPFMYRAMEESGESVNLAILDGTETIYLSQVESRQMMRALAPPGGRAPLHASGVGKAMLAGLSPDAAGEKIKSLGFAKYTDKTVRNGVALLDDIARARSRAFAVDDEEHAVGLRCVASPVFNEYEEPVAAISISGPQARIPDERLPELGALIGRIAASITGAIGGKQPAGFGQG
ncbi:MAG: IclR family transcriptional regulator C-terminal domain-containing protein [Alphaproteobacteria bacterium]|uniref:IclR family transcriptional regulator domain-containing protein n=1 Tax=Pacificispira sp. TaxID=2888761 RepID=UPI001B235822|nr:helix-turn-helix domain-containing protein [Alphaproteobacteria bacterium]MBO6861642.1 helix-turn-helix domain-containing protein [Alphaproteobacteria bacterium]MEC9268815.1 IclR family transcriptional regulator C-terminal domain-containing protein [Pseudomonadota bacterium]